MRIARLAMLLFGYFSLATILAEAGMLAVLWQRHQLTWQTLHRLQVVALDVPVRQMYDELKAQAEPAKGDMLSFAELQRERTMASLDLDLRELSADKGLIDLRDLDFALDQESIRYAEIRDEFERRWQLFQVETTDSELQELSRQLASISPDLAKDQLLRILEDENLDPESALNDVVAIFRSLPVDKRKKIILQFEAGEAPSLHEVMRQIRLGMPQSRLIAQTREQLQQMSSR